MIYCIELVAEAIKNAYSYVAPSFHNNNNNVMYGSACELPMQIHSLTGAAVCCGEEHRGSVEDQVHVSRHILLFASHQRLWRER